MKQWYEVHVTAYIGERDYTVKVQADDEYAARSEAESTVFNHMKLDDFSLTMDITATSCDEVKA